MPQHDQASGWVTCPCPEDPNFDAGTTQGALTELRHLSVAGVQFSLPRLPQADALLSVEFLCGPNRFSRPFTARVVNARKDPESGWRIECEFVRRFTDEELRSALGHSTPA